MIDDLLGEISNPSPPKTKKKWKKKKQKPKNADFDPLEALSSEYTVVESQVDDEVVVSSVSGSKPSKKVTVPKLDTQQIINMVGSISPSKDSDSSGSI